MRTVAADSGHYATGADVVINNVIIASNIIANNIIESNIIINVVVLNVSHDGCRVDIF